MMTETAVSWTAEQQCCQQGAQGQGSLAVQCWLAEAVLHGHQTPKVGLPGVMTESAADL